MQGCCESGLRIARLTHQATTRQLLPGAGTVRLGEFSGATARLELPRTMDLPASRSRRDARLDRGPGRAQSGRMGRANAAASPERPAALARRGARGATGAVERRD